MGAKAPSMSSKSVDVKRIVIDVSLDARRRFCDGAPLRQFQSPRMDCGIIELDDCRANRL